MKTKICVFLLILSATTSLWAQLSINDYKYVSVPDKFDFLKSNDQYQLNSLTKYLLTKNGFTVLNKSDNYPKDLAQNNCLLLNANVVKIKGLLITKLQLLLTNCKNTVVFSSEIGKSKLKDYQKAYHEALRDVFTLSEFNYAYEPSDRTDVLPKTPEMTPIEPTSEIVSEQPQAPSVPAVEVASGLIIQQTNSGYDFINSDSKTVKYSVHATLFENVYIIEGMEGIIYKRGQSWVRESIENGKTTIEALNIQR
jgi:hypothetical protein